MSWDDGEHAKVKSVQLTFDDVISSIQVEYHGTNLQSQRRGTVGPKSDGFTLSLDEYITEVSGYTKTTFAGNVITALTFKTNKKTYGPYGNKTRDSFSVFAPSGKQIAGFSGTSGNALSSIDVHFAPIPPPGSIGPDGPETKPGGVDDGGSKPGGPETKPGGGGDGGSKPDGPETKPGGGGDGGSKPDGPETKPGGGDDGGSKPGGSEKTELFGGNKGNPFDDGTFDGVKKVTISADQYSITYIKIEYEKDGKIETREHGTKRGDIKEFLVDYPKDKIIAVGGSYDHIFNYDTTLVTSLYFTTSKGFTSPKFGETKGTEFKLEGGNLVGFHGRGDFAIDAIGAHFSPLPAPFPTPAPAPAPAPTPAPAPAPTLPPSSKPVGGDKGNTFDDGVFDGVKKVTISADQYSITYIKIEYEKDGKVETREHGTLRGDVKEFKVNYPKDYIVAMGGSYDHIFNYDTTLVTSLYFTTSKGFTSPKFGETKGTEFNLKGEKLVGFHGRGDFAIDAIGAHFGTGSSGPPTPEGGSTDGVQKLEAQGGKGGNQWDDGSDHDGVVKIHVAAGGLGVEVIKFDYVKNGNTKEGPSHGVKARAPISTFEISPPDEHLISVEGFFDSSDIIQGIEFKTNKKSKSFGYPFSGDGTQFSLQVKDKKIVGFHGFADSHINSIGAYFAPITASTLKPAKKLQAVGGNEGAIWDDGAFDGVKKILVGQGNIGVSFVTFEYNKGSQTIIGDGHGKKTLLDPESFELEYPSEYITAVGVYYESLQGEKGGTTVVTSLIFKTNKRTSQSFGMTGGDYVELKEEGNKIVGFHGKADDYVHQLGVYVAPIAN